MEPTLEWWMMMMVELLLLGVRACQRRVWSFEIEERDKKSIKSE
jgi:hypothetical protein